MRTWILMGFLLIYQALEVMAGRDIPTSQGTVIVYAVVLVVGLIMDIYEFVVRIVEDK